jgi:flagellar protein FliS
MDLNYSLNQYQRTQFTTADQGQLILMMYDGAIRFIEQARNRILSKDIPGKGIYIGKAQSIFSELNGCLDLKKGGNLATSLETLYLYVNNQLSLANIKNSFENLDNALRVVKELREGWRGIIHRAQGRVSPQSKVAAAAGVRSTL